MTMDLTEAQARLIREWAVATRYIEAVLLFGSRAKRSARPDSDVDLALTAEAGHYVALVAKWEAEPPALLGLTVHVRDFARNEAIRDACHECSKLLS